MKDILLRDSAAEKLRDEKQKGETLSDTVERLDEDAHDVWMFAPDVPNQTSRPTTP